MKVDKIIKNAKIFTSNKNSLLATALAVKDGKFVYVGDDAGLSDYEGEITDLSGKFIMPGIIDSHVHVTMPIGFEYKDMGEYIMCDSKKEALDFIADHIKNNPGRESYNFLLERVFLHGEEITKEDLDAVCADSEIMILEGEAHSIWVNSRLLARHGITDDIVDPVPGLSYYVRINFSGFQDIIDTLGGVDVYSEHSFTSETEEGTYSYSEGVNHLNGEEALGFARARYAFVDGDRQRGRNQMQVIKATIEKLESPETLKNYASLMDNMSGSFQTDMAKDDIGYLVQSTLDNGGWKVLTYSVSGSDAEEVCYSLGGSAYVMLPNQSDVSYGTELINKVLNGEDLTQDEINVYIENKDNEDKITEQTIEETTEEGDSEYSDE